MTVTHGSFTIEQHLDAPRELVFRAYAEQGEKAKWFAHPTQIGTPEWTFDFSVGGTETNHFTYTDEQIEGTPLPSGTTGSFEARYYDIVTNERIVFAYDMVINGQRISVSLQTVEFTSMEGGTLLTLTEHAAFLENSDGVEIRERGTRQLLDALAKSLASD